MNPTMIELKKSIEENKNILLQHYTHLVDTHEALQQLYDKILTDSKLESNPTAVEKGAGVYCLNSAFVITKFILIDVVTGIKVYESDNYTFNRDWQINFSTLNVAPGTQYYVKAVVSGGDDSIASYIVEYEPNPTNCTVGFILYGSVFKTHFDLYFDCMQPKI